MQPRGFFRLATTGIQDYVMAFDFGTNRICQRFACLLLMLPALLLAEEGAPANFDLNLQFDPGLINAVEFELLCNSGEPRRQQLELSVAGRKRLNLTRFEDGEPVCQMRALLPHGYSVEYQSASAEKHRANEHGCQFTTVSHGQSYDCLISITQNAVPLMVYKKWVGGTGQEPDVEIQLACADHAFTEPRFINRESPGGWEVSEIGVDGLSCDVIEMPGDTFVADQSDCQGLLLFPARGAECTMVNTKIVKRIEMLNRYGKAIMILVMLVAGLAAVRRYV
jgi:hypothetical protein